MQTSMQKALSNKNSLRITALIIGFMLWSIFSKIHNHTVKLKVPLCFFNLEEKLEINAPEDIYVELRGKRSSLRAIDFDSLAAHVDCRKLKKGKTQIKLSRKNLFLPEKISLLEYKPLNLFVEKF